MENLCSHCDTNTFCVGVHVHVRKGESGEWGEHAERNLFCTESAL
jgi:hypothetical protein